MGQPLLTPTPTRSTTSLEDREQESLTIQDKNIRVWEDSMRTKSKSGTLKSGQSKRLGQMTRDESQPGSQPGATKRLKITSIPEPPLASLTTPASRETETGTPSTLTSPSLQDPGRNQGHPNGSRPLVFGATDIRYRSVNDILMMKRQPRGPKTNPKHSPAEGSKDKVAQTLAKPNPRQPAAAIGTLKEGAWPKPNRTQQTAEGGPSDDTRPWTKTQPCAASSSQGRAHGC